MVRLKDIKPTNLTVKKNVDTWEMFGIRFFGSNRHELLNLVNERLNSGKRNLWLATVNPEFVMIAAKDRDFYDILKKTTLNVVDGVGLVWAKRVRAKKGVFPRLKSAFKTGKEIFSGKIKEETISGSDLMIDLCREAENKGRTIYFLGGWNDRAKRTAEYFKKEFKGLNVAGFYAGQATGEDDQILAQLEGKKIDILFVAYGMKKQEEWIARNLKYLNVGLVVGVGRSFDYYSGDLKRAPLGWRKAGLEWLYSLGQEPKRLKRQLALPRFILKVITED